MNIKREKKTDNQFNKKLENWNHRQHINFIKYKAEEQGKRVIKVNPKNTSRIYSQCGYIDKANRKGSAFKCKNCGFELNADLNASPNIATLAMSEYGRLCQQANRSIAR